jgi:hypothetical protein
VHPERGRQEYAKVIGDDGVVLQVVPIELASCDMVMISARFSFSIWPSVFPATCTGWSCSSKKRSAWDCQWPWLARGSGNGGLFGSNSSIWPRNASFTHW